MQSLTHRAPCVEIGSVTQHTDEHGTVVTSLSGFKFHPEPGKTEADYPPDAFGWEVSDLQWAHDALGQIQTL